MNIRFWVPVAVSPNVNKSALPEEYRGKTKAELVKPFMEAGFRDETWVLVINRKNEPDSFSEPKQFAEVDDEAVYTGRANRISGSQPRGILHAFVVK